MKRWIPPVIALLVFLCALGGFVTAIKANKPPKVEVLAATRDLQPGDIIAAGDLQTTEVYDDARASAYIPADRQEDIVGGIVLQPFAAGDPLTKLGVAAAGTVDSRLAGLLTDFPDYAIFPLPLDLQNITAPEINSFNVGDVITLTVVIGERPSVPRDPDKFNEYYQNGFLLPGAEATPAPVPVTTPEPTPDFMDYTERGKPPVAKTITTEGYRVVAVMGKVTNNTTENQDMTTYTMDVTPPRPVLMLLVPQDQIEEVALAVSQGEVFVSLALHVKATEGGFSYWDFEQMLKEERQRQEKLHPSPTPTPANP